MCITHKASKEPDVAWRELVIAIAVVDKDTTWNHLWLDRGNPVLCGTHKASKEPYRQHVHTTCLPLPVGTSSLHAMSGVTPPPPTVSATTSWHQADRQHIHTPPAYPHPSSCYKVGFGDCGRSGGCVGWSSGVDGGRKGVGLPWCYHNTVTCLE